MTRSHLPDLLLSTRTHRPADVISAPFKESPPRGPCDPAPCPPAAPPPQQRNAEDQRRRPSSPSQQQEEEQQEEEEEPGRMESPYRRAERHAANAEAAWSASGRPQQRYRFSAPDIFSHRLLTAQPAPQPSTAAAADMAVPEQKRRTRSKSAPRVPTNLLTMSFEGPSSAGRRGRDPQRGPAAAPHWRAEVSPRRQPCYAAAARALLHDVHPSKLQAQPHDTSRYSPCYVDPAEEAGLEKPATSPHVRCRVDIKPDEAALLHQASHQGAVLHQAGGKHHRHHSGGRRSLTVPRHFSYSRTPTPTDSLGTEYRHPVAGQQYSRSMPNTYLQPVEISMQRMPSPMGDYDGREHRGHPGPGTPGSYFYTEEPARYVSAAPPRPSSYFPEECFMSGQNLTPKVQYVQDPRTRLVHAVATAPYFTEVEPPPSSSSSYPYPGPSAYGKPCGGDGGPFIIRTPPARTFYGDDPRMYQIQTAPPRLCYPPPEDVYGLPPEHHYPARAYYTEGRRHARVVQPHSDDWYGSEVSGYSTNPASYVSQVTPTRVRQDPPHWSPAPCVEPPRIGSDSKSYSRSWDNILSSGHAEREQPRSSVHRGQSYDDLLDPRKPPATGPVHEDKPQPVVVNLSSSPRRYAALSMSDNSLMDKSPTEASGSAAGRHWFVTPEITITDNDLRPSSGLGRAPEGLGRAPDGRSASWDVLDSRHAAVAPESSGQRGSMSSCFATSANKEKTQDNNASLQQSLEQLDELLADLVTDYRPPSRRASEDILDQLKKLIDQEEAASLSRKAEPLPLDKQPTSIRMDPERHGHGHVHGHVPDTDGSSSDALKSADECSPDQSPDEDDTMMCSNNKCRRTETLFNACLYFKSCHSCYTYYCSRNCRREDWDVHKESCLYGRVGSVCRHVIKHCRETAEVHRAFSRVAKVGFLSRGRGVLFLGFPNPGSSSVFLQRGLEGLSMSPTYLSLRELEGFRDNLGAYASELQEAGQDYDPNECFLLNVSIAVGEQLPCGAAPRSHTPTVRKYAKVALASFSPERKLQREEKEREGEESGGGGGGGGGGAMETLILTPPPGTADLDKEGEAGRRAREVCFINTQRELRIRGVALRSEYPAVYRQLCDFVERNHRFTPTTIYPTDKRTGKQFMCMIMAASEPRTLDWVGTPHLLDDII